VWLNVSAGEGRSENILLQACLDEMPIRGKDISLELAGKPRRLRSIKSFVADLDKTCLRVAQRRHTLCTLELRLCPFFAMALLEL